MKETVATILVVLSTLGVIFSVYAMEKHRASRAYNVELIARSPEHGNWYPHSLTLPYGKPVRIMIRNIDTFSHGFAIPELDVVAGDIKAGTVELVEFTPRKRGTFTFYCTVWCSPYHPDMYGELTIK